MTQRVGRCIALLFHGRGTRREWSAARPGRTLPPGKTRYPFYRRLGGPQGRSGRAENLVHTGIRSRTVQPVVQSLYRLSYLAHKTNEYQEYFLGSKGDQCVGLTTSPPSCAGAEITNEWRCTSTFPYALMAWRRAVVPSFVICHVRCMRLSQKINFRFINLVTEELTTIFIKLGKLDTDCSLSVPSAEVKSWRPRI